MQLLRCTLRGPSKHRSTAEAADREPSSTAYPQRACTQTSWPLQDYCSMVKAPALHAQHLGTCMHAVQHHQHPTEHAAPSVFCVLPTTCLHLLTLLLMLQCWQDVSDEPVCAEEVLEGVQSNHWCRLSHKGDSDRRQAGHHAGQHTFYRSEPPAPARKLTVVQDMQHTSALSTHIATQPAIPAAV